jgi:membrane protein DedA with SNARE-associated domain
VLALFGRLVTEEIARYGYVAIFVLMLLESACVPIPSEVTMLFGGALVSTPVLAPEQQLNFLAVALVGAAANLVGSWLAYWVGHAGGRPLVDRWGRYLLLRPHEIDRAHEWFERYGQETVFFGRLLPVVRTFISLPAGVARMRFSKFTVYTLLGCLPWTFGLTFVGYKLGERWDQVERLVRPVSWLLVALIVAGIGWWVWRRVRYLRAHPIQGTQASAGEEPGGREGEPAARG